MRKTIKMDEAGRVVIPRAIRQRYGLGEGSHELEVLESAEGIVLRPSLEETPAKRHESGWVVFHSGDPESIDPTAALDRERERRHRQLTSQRSAERDA